MLELLDSLCVSFSRPVLLVHDLFVSLWIKTTATLVRAFVLSLRTLKSVFLLTVLNTNQNIVLSYYYYYYVTFTSLFNNTSSATNWHGNETNRSPLLLRTELLRRHYCLPQQPPVVLINTYTVLPPTAAKHDQAGVESNICISGQYGR